MVDRTANNYKSAYKYAREMLKKHPHRDVTVYYDKNGVSGRKGRYYFKLTLKPKSRIKNQIISRPFSQYKK